MGYACFMEYPLKISDYIHQYDLAVYFSNQKLTTPDGMEYTLRYIFSEYSTTKQLIKYKYKNLLDKQIAFLIEVDDPDLHSKPIKKKNDKIAEIYANHYIPQAQFIRLNKYEINGEPLDRLAYFQRYLDPLVMNP